MSATREKPGDLIYGLDDRPPFADLPAGLHYLLGSPLSVAVLSGYLAGVAADGIRTSVDGDDCVVKLRFRV